MVNLQFANRHIQWIWLLSFLQFSVFLLSKSSYSFKNNSLKQMYQYAGLWIILVRCFNMAWSDMQAYNIMQWSHYQWSDYLFRINFNLISIYGTSNRPYNLYIKLASQMSYIALTNVNFTYLTKNKLNWNIPRLHWAVPVQNLLSWKRPGQKSSRAKPLSFVMQNRPGKTVHFFISKKMKGKVF